METLNLGSSALLVPLLEQSYLRCGNSCVVRKIYRSPIHRCISKMEHDSDSSETLRTVSSISMSEEPYDDDLDFLTSGDDSQESEASGSGRNSNTSSSSSSSSSGSRSSRISTLHAPLRSFFNFFCELLEFFFFLMIFAYFWKAANNNSNNNGNNCVHEICNIVFYCDCVMTAPPRTNHVICKLCGMGVNIGLKCGKCVIRLFLVKVMCMCVCV
jgi:hypothetical protein